MGALLYYYMEDYKNSDWAVDRLGINGICTRAEQNVSGRLHYGYKNTYFFDANFGYTGSSQFAKGAKVGLLPLHSRRLGAHQLRMGTAEYALAIVPEN